MRRKGSTVPATPAQPHAALPEPELAETVAATASPRIDLAGMRHLILEIRAGRENPD